MLMVKNTMLKPLKSIFAQQPVQILEDEEEYTDDDDEDFSEYESGDSFEEDGEVKDQESQVPIDELAPLSFDQATALVAAGTPLAQPEKDYEKIPSRVDQALKEALETAVDSSNALQSDKDTVADMTDYAPPRHLDGRSDKMRASISAIARQQLLVDSARIYADAAKSPSTRARTASIFGGDSRAAPLISRRSITPGIDLAPSNSRNHSCAPSRLSVSSKRSPFIQESVQKEEPPVKKDLPTISPSKLTIDINAVKTSRGDTSAASPSQSAMSPLLSAASPISGARRERRRKNRSASIRQERPNLSSMPPTSGASPTTPRRKKPPKTLDQVEILSIDQSDVSDHELSPIINTRRNMQLSMLIFEAERSVSQAPLPENVPTESNYEELTSKIEIPPVEQILSSPQSSSPLDSQIIIEISPINPIIDNVQMVNDILGVPFEAPVLDNKTLKMVAGFAARFSRRKKAENSIDVAVVEATTMKALDMTPWTPNLVGIENLGSPSPNQSENQVIDKKTKRLVGGFVSRFTKKKSQLGEDSSIGQAFVATSSGLQPDESDFSLSSPDRKKKGMFSKPTNIMTSMFTNDRRSVGLTEPITVDVQSGGGGILSSRSLDLPDQGPIEKLPESGDQSITGKGTDNFIQGNLKSSLSSRDTEFRDASTTIAALSKQGSNDSLQMLSNNASSIVRKSSVSGSKRISMVKSLLPPPPPKGQKRGSVVSNSGSNQDLSQQRHNSGVHPSSCGLGTSSASTCEDNSFKGSSQSGDAISIDVSSFCSQELLRSSSSITSNSPSLLKVEDPLIDRIHYNARTSVCESIIEKDDPIEVNDAARGASIICMPLAEAHGPSNSFLTQVLDTKIPSQSHIKEPKCSSNNMDPNSELSKTLEAQTYAMQSQEQIISSSPQVNLNSRICAAFGSILSEQLLGIQSNMERDIPIVVNDAAGCASISNISKPLTEAHTQSNSDLTSILNIKIPCQSSFKETKSSRNDLNYELSKSFEARNNAIKPQEEISNSTSQVNLTSGFTAASGSQVGKQSLDDRETAEKRSNTAEIPKVGSPHLTSSSERFNSQQLKKSIMKSSQNLAQQVADAIKNRVASKTDVSDVAKSVDSLGSGLTEEQQYDTPIPPRKPLTGSNLSLFRSKANITIEVSRGASSVSIDNLISKNSRSGSETGLGCVNGSDSKSSIFKLLNSSESLKEKKLSPVMQKLLSKEVIQPDERESKSNPGTLIENRKTQENELNMVEHIITKKDIRIEADQVVQMVDSAFESSPQKSIEPIVQDHPSVILEDRQKSSRVEGSLDDKPQAFAEFVEVKSHLGSFLTGGSNQVKSPPEIFETGVEIMKQQHSLENVTTRFEAPIIAPALPPKTSPKLPHAPLFTKSAASKMAAPVLVTNAPVFAAPKLPDGAKITADKLKITPTFVKNSNPTLGKEAEPALKFAAPILPPAPVFVKAAPGLPVAPVLQRASPILSKAAPILPKTAPLFAGASPGKPAPVLVKPGVPAPVLKAPIMNVQPNASATELVISSKLIQTKETDGDPSIS